MSKYIDAEKLIAEIERQMGLLPKEQGVSINLDWARNTLVALHQFITSLQQEQPEVELEKELDQWRHKHFKGKRDGDYSGEYLERESQLDIARHFWNKGYNARKEK